MKNRKMIPVFPANSRVCFLGDSLTSGFWVENIFDFYLEKFPQGNIRIYDNGIGGGTCDYAMAHNEEDLFTFRPTHVVISFSENDIGLFGACGDYEETKRLYTNAMKSLTEQVTSHGCTVYFLCPPPAPSREERVINPRKIAHEVMNELAEKYDTYICDMYELAAPYVKKYDFTDPDGCHMTDLGKSIFAKLFVRSQGFDDFDPEEAGFGEVTSLSYDADHRLIFDEKIRRIWLAMRSISTTGDTTEAKVKRLRQRLFTRADGAWDDFCYYRAVDFIELYPNMDFYREMLERSTDEMIEKAMKKQ